MPCCSWAVRRIDCSINVSAWLERLPLVDLGWYTFLTRERPRVGAGEAALVRALGAGEGRGVEWVDDAVSGTFELSSSDPRGVKKLVEFELDDFATARYVGHGVVLGLVEGLAIGVLTGLGAGFDAAGVGVDFGRLGNSARCLTRKLVILLRAESLTRCLKSGFLDTISLSNPKRRKARRTLMTTTQASGDRSSSTEGIIRSRMIRFFR